MTSTVIDAWALSEQNRDFCQAVLDEVNRDQP